MTETANAPAAQVNVLKTPEYQKLLAETEKLAKANAKLAKKVEDQKTALKGKQTEIKNLKKSGNKKMHISQH